MSNRLFLTNNETFSSVYGFLRSLVKLQFVNVSDLLMALTANSLQHLLMVGLLKKRRFLNGRQH